MSVELHHCNTWLQFQSNPFLLKALLLLLAGVHRHWEGEKLEASGCFALLVHLETMQAGCLEMPCQEKIIFTSPMYRDLSTGLKHFNIYFFLKSQ